MMVKSDGTLATGTWGSCPWEISFSGTLTVHPGMGTDIDLNSYEADNPWADYAGSITTAIFAWEEERKVIAPEKIQGMFMRFSQLETADLSGMDTSSVVCIDDMFGFCTSLESIDMTGWDTSSVKDANAVFNGCSSLKAIDLSGWDTSSLEHMYGMFFGCGALTSLDLSSFDTSKVQTMNSLFSYCSSLVDVVVTSFDLSGLSGKGGGLSAVFNECSSLATLDLSSWSIPKAMKMEDMFKNCSSLKTIYACEDWPLGEPKGFSPTFDGCISLVGGNGTMYSEMHADAYYACIDRDGTPGYFTAKGATVQAVGLSHAAIASIPSQSFTGSDVKPDVFVQIEGKTLEVGVDYTLSYTDNAMPGRASAYITGKGSYTGTRAVSFKIREPFSDVDPMTPHYADIIWLAGEGTDIGYPDGSFHPYDYVSRSDMAAFLYRLSGSQAFTPSAAETACFADVTSSTPHAKEIWWLISQGITGGWTESDGSRTFRPDQPIARCDMSVLLYRVAGEPAYTPIDSEKVFFSDIDSSVPNANEILWLASVGLSVGWTEEDGSRTFRPFEDIARCDMAAFLHRMDKSGFVKMKPVV